MRRGLCTKDNKTTKLMQHPAIAAQRRVSYNVGRARILYGLDFFPIPRLASSQQVIRLHKLSPSPLPADAPCSCRWVLRKSRIRNPPHCFAPVVFPVSLDKAAHSRIRIFNLLSYKPFMNIITYMVVTYCTLIYKLIGTNPTAMVTNVPRKPKKQRHLSQRYNNIFNVIIRQLSKYYLSGNPIIIKNSWNKYKT